MSDHRYEAEIRLTDASGATASRHVEYTTAQPTADEAVKELRQRLVEAAPGKVTAVNDQG